MRSSSVDLESRTAGVDVVHGLLYGCHTQKVQGLKKECLAPTIVIILCTETQSHRYIDTWTLKDRGCKVDWLPKASKIQ